MVKAIITLTPTHSKKFIAMAISRMEVVRKAFNEGMIVLHPSSSTYFIVEELIGEKPPTNYWVCGMIVPKGLCLEIGVKFSSRFVLILRGSHMSGPLEPITLWEGLSSMRSVRQEYMGSMLPVKWPLESMVPIVWQEMP